ncbi:hypothetical protein [Aliikangiella maris]|uniref:Uncharacterized protein n=2 Tax=Aliikangiella maris TaxID=3162458 RepID=A0ABV3MNF3_9GAMM
MTTIPFIIQAGMSTEDYQQKNSHYVKKRIDKQPAGLNFYEYRWPVKENGQVRVDAGSASFLIPNVLSIVGTEDTEALSRGIYDFSINSGLTPDEFIEHDQARILLMSHLQSLLTLGWKPYLEFHIYPRLSGKQSFQFAIEDGFYTPDPTYTPDLDEWMKLKYGGTWTFFNEKVFLEVRLRRESQFIDVNRPGVYLLTHTVLTNEAKAQSYFKGEERYKWQSLWADEIKKDKRKRYEKEVELIQQGYRINTRYVDPIIHPDDPIEPEDVEELLAIIEQHAIE